MIINKLKINLYGLIIVIAVLIGMLYIYKDIKEDIRKNKNIILFYLMYIAFAFTFGKIYTSIIYLEDNFLTAGLSAYGGLIGVVIASIIFEKIISLENRLVKSTIISLPLVYCITKIACSISGCCGGIPYNGFFKIKYPAVQNIWQFPIQQLEVIIFFIIFLIVNKKKKNKYISYITLFLIAIFKFILDFLRYDHVNILITRNQIFSVILLLTTVSIFFIKVYKKFSVKNK